MIILKDKYNLVDDSGFTFLKRVEAIIFIAFLNDDIQLTHDEDENMNYISLETMDVIRMISLEDFESLVYEFNKKYLTRFYNRDIDVLLKHIQERSHAEMAEKIIKLKEVGHVM